MNTSRILYIEDDTDIADLYKMRKEMEGFDVLWLSGGQDVLMRSVQFAPDLIVLDLMLPGIDGETLLKHFREDTATKDTPIVILSAISDNPDIDRLKSLGADEFIIKSQKPLDEVMDIMKSHLKTPA